MVDWKRGYDLFFKRRARFAMRDEIARDVMAEVHKLLSLEWREVDGQPIVSPAGIALRNAQLANLNLKYFGYELARALAAALPVRTGTVASHVGLGCKPSTQADLESDWATHWLAELKVPLIFHRKMWELAYVLQQVHDAGLLREGARALGFGCGTEPLPSYFAAQGMAVTVTDLPPERAQAAGWADTHQHAASLYTAFRPELVERADFDRLVTHQTADMNAIPAALGDYDLCWSVCALEHLGSIEAGLAFIEKALATLRPGGVAVHTTELNVDADGPTFERWPTVLFQPRHFEALAARLAAKGHSLAPLDFALGDKPLDRFIDLPPWPHEMSPGLHGWSAEAPHLKVAVDGLVATCFGIVVRKAG